MAGTHGRWHAIRLRFADWTLFERLWLLVFTAVTLYVSLAVGDSVLGVVAAITGIVNVVLVAKGKISNYYFGIVSVSLYGLLSLEQRFYGEVTLNLGYLLPMQFIGLWLWRRHRADNGGGDDVAVRVMGWRQRAVWATVAVAACGVYALVLEWFGGNLPYWDSTSTVLTVVAMVLMVGRYIEQWPLWTVINVVTIYMWAVAYAQGGGSASIVVMWIAYLVNAIYGWWKWARLERGVQAAG